MSNTKIALSTKELKMLNDTELILTKQKIIEQVYVLLESLVDEIDQVVLPAWYARCGNQLSSPRIFKGENYLGLPYVTLDHPRLFGAQHTFALRTMLWWGKFISVTLHASAVYKMDLLENLNKLMPHEKDLLYICIGENQWHHHFEATNYIPLRDIEAEQMIKIKYEREFIKVAAKADLAQFNELKKVLIPYYQIMAKIIG